MDNREKEVIVRYFKEMPDNEKTELYSKARNLIADKITKDEDFLSDMLPVLQNKFKDIDTMINGMIEDAVESKVTIDELSEYPEEWLSWISRL